MLYKNFYVFIADYKVTNCYKRIWLWWIQSGPKTSQCEPDNAL